MSSDAMKSESATEDWMPESPPIPNHWVYVDFEEAFENLPLTGLKIPQKEYEQSGEYPVIDQGANLIGGYTNDLDKVLHISRSAIVFGDHTKCFKYISFPFAPGADEIKVLVPRNNVVEKYAFYACKSLRLPDRGYSRHYSFLKKNKFPLPPINEQHSIVAKIETLFSELDKGIESLKTAREQLKVYRQAVLKHAFEGKLTEQWRKENVDKLEIPEQFHCESEITKEELFGLPRIPPEWKYARLGSFILGIDAGKSFKCDEREPSEEEIGVAKVSAVTWGEYDESESKTCNDLGKINESYFIRKGDFLLSRANTIELVGACVIAKNVTKRIMLSDKTLRIEFSSLLQEYFLYWLRSPIGRNEIMSRSSGNQESMRNIGQNRIKSIAFPLCGAKETEKISKIVEQQETQMQKLNGEIASELARAEILRQSILKKAFSGRLVETKVET